MTRKNKLRRLEVGELYRWNPKYTYDIVHEYTIYMGRGLLECLFKQEFAEHFTKEELVMPIEIARLPGCKDTQYRVILTSGRIGWISIDDTFIGDWKKVTKPL